MKAAVSHRWRRALLGSLLALLVPTEALASSGLDSPEAGTAHIGRGGAWLAKADNPLAAYFNPAAMVRNANGAHLGAQMMFRSHCFDRRDENGAPVAPGNGLGAPTEAVCAEAPPIPNPQLGVSFRVHRKVALGFAIVAPHASGMVDWPETVVYANERFGPIPTPARSDTSCCRIAPFR